MERTLSIDEILDPSYRARVELQRLDNELAKLDKQIKHVDALIASNQARLRDLSTMETAELRKLADEIDQRMLTLSGTALLAAEDEQCEVAAELEWRMNHIRVRGQVVRIKLDRISAGFWLAYELEFDIGMPVAQGHDAWDAREELQSILEDGEDNDGRPESVISDERRRDAEFARIVGGAQP